MTKQEVIIIASGREQADYLISLFKSSKNKKIIVINEDEHFAEFLCKKHGIPVYIGQITKTFNLEEAGVQDADIFIALNRNDQDNYVACVLAKELFNVKKCICTVTNPKNVQLFKDLGVDSVVSSTYLLAESVENESNLEEVMKTLSLEHGKISITEVMVAKGDYAANKKIMDMKMPQVASIACIYRNPNVIIPNGSIIIKPDDKLTIVCETKDAAMIKEFIVKGPQEEQPQEKGK